MITLNLDGKLEQVIIASGSDHTYTNMACLAKIYIYDQALLSI